MSSFEYISYIQYIQYILHFSHIFEQFSHVSAGQDESEWHAEIEQHTMHKDAVHTYTKACSIHIRNMSHISYIILYITNVKYVPHVKYVKYVVYMTYVTYGSLSLPSFHRQWWCQWMKCYYPSVKIKPRTIAQQISGEMWFVGTWKGTILLNGCETLHIESMIEVA